MAKLFSGLSTVGSTKNKNFKLYDIELVRQDLINHFYTRIGERVMRPDYGCRIWDYLMEPYTDYIKGLIETEVKRICNSDQRVKLVNYTIGEYQNGLAIEVQLNYIPFEKTDEFVLIFENNEQLRF